MLHPNYPFASYSRSIEEAKKFSSRKTARCLANKLITRGDLRFLSNQIKQATTIAIQ